MFCVCFVYVYIYIYIYNKKCFLFVNHVKTIERINMGLWPYDAKLSVDCHRLLFFFGFYIPFPIFLLINIHQQIFPPIKTEDTHITVAMETYVVSFLLAKRKVTASIYIYIYIVWMSKTCFFVLQQYTWVIVADGQNAEQRAKWLSFTISQEHYHEKKKQALLIKIIC